jgi:hypothetical protein
MFKIDFKSRFWSSTGKVILLLVFTFVPLAANIIIAVIPAEDKILALSQKLIPGELLAYCLSLIAPLFILFLRTHGEGFKIPWLNFVFIISLFVYGLALVLSLIAKNSWISGIDMKPGHRDFYFWLSIISLAIAIFLRFFSVYHESRFSDYNQTRAQQQSNFNQSLKNIIG